MPHLPVELQIVAQLHHHSVDARPGKTLLQQVFEQIAIFPFLRSHQRGQHQKRRSLGQLQNPLDNLIAALGGNRPAALRAMSLANPGEQHSQIVVNFGDRADRGPRILARAFLRDRNRRAQPGNVVDIGLGHLPQKLPGEARQAFHVPALPLGIQRVEGQRTFARSADAGQANQLIPRQHQIDAAKVMFASATDDDIGCRHAV